MLNFVLMRSAFCRSLDGQRQLSPHKLARDPGMLKWPFLSFQNYVLLHFHMLSEDK